MKEQAELFKTKDFYFSYEKYWNLVKSAGSNSHQIELYYLGQLFRAVFRSYVMQVKNSLNLYKWNAA
jgi:hypothetical protein